MSRLSEVESRLQASQSASGDLWEVTSLTVHGGYAVASTEVGEVSTDGYLPEESAELFAHAPADLAALLDFAQEIASAWVNAPDGDALSQRIYAALEELENS